MKTVELLVAYTNNTWSTLYFNFPDEDIKYMDNDELIIHILKNNHLDGAIVFTAVYNIKEN